MKLASVASYVLTRDEIANWYFESPVALWYDHPLYFSFNDSVMSISQDNKLRTIPVSCAAHDVAPNWSLTPPKEQSAIVKLPSNSLHLTKHTRETEEEWELGPVPALSYVKNGGPVDAWSQCKASFGYRICNKSVLFTIQLS